MPQWIETLTMPGRPDERASTTPTGDWQRYGIKPGELLTVEISGGRASFTRRSVAPGGQIGDVIESRKLHAGDSESLPLNSQDRVVLKITAVEDRSAIEAGLSTID